MKNGITPELGIVAVLSLISNHSDGICPCWSCTIKQDTVYLLVLVLCVMQTFLASSGIFQQLLPPDRK